MRYFEFVLPGLSDPLGQVRTLADSGLFGELVVYERAGSWSVAADMLGEVVVDAGSIRSRWLAGGRPRRPGTAETHSIEPEPVVETMEAWTERPLDQVGRALARFPLERWTAYGWMGFEFGYAVAGRPQLAGSQTLLHMMVPRTEIQLATDAVRVRTVDPEVMAELRPLFGARADEPGPARTVQVLSDAGSYHGKVASAVSDIRRGDLQKVIISRTAEVPFAVDLPATYVVGRRNNTPARSFLLDLGSWRAAGFSPETVAEVSADGRVSTQPLAGTRAFGTGSETDEALRLDLETDAKEVYEHATSVKLAFTELLAVCEPESVHVSEFMSVKPRGSVQHLASRVAGQLAAGRSSWDALQAVFPAVTASGIPKAPAYERIAALEDEPRGMYAGAVLAADSDGALDAALVLRAVYSRAGRTWLRAGAGLVADSTPEREFEETCEKLHSVAPFVIEQSPTTISQDHRRAPAAAPRVPAC